MYQFIFDHIDNPTISTGNIKASVEPGFYVTIILFKWLFPHYYTLFLMLFFAIVAVALHSIAIYKYSFNPFLALLVYYSNFYFLHEMTQIRIGIAISIILISIPFFIKGRFLLFSLLILFSGLFHYSSLLLFGIFLFRRNNFQKKWFVTLLISSIPLGLLKLKGMNVFEFLSSIDSSNDKLVNYSNLTIYNIVHEANIFNTMNILSILICSYLLYMIPKKDLLKDQYLSLFLKFNIVSIFLFCLNSSNALIAFRVSELFGISTIFIFPYLTRYLPFRKFNIWFVVFVALVYFYINIFAGDLIKPYQLYNLSR